MNPFLWLAKTITEHPRVVAATALLVFIIALYGMTLVTMQTSNDAYIDKDTPRGALLAHYSDTYSSDAIMLIIESDDVTNVETLLYIDRLSEDISNERYIERVSGVVSLLKGMNGGVIPRSSAEVTSLLDSIPPDVLKRNLPSNMMTLAVVTLQPGLSEDRQKEVLNGIRVITKVSTPPPGVTVTLSGEPVFDQEMGEEMGSSMGSLIMAAMLLMIIAVMALFSHVRYTLLPVAVVASGLVLTFGLMGLTGTEISMVVIGAFPVLIGIGIDYAIQIHSRIDEEVKKTSLSQAVITTVTKTCPSVMVAMLATSTGFIAMVFGPIPMVGDFGITCTFGVISCYLAALIIVPVFAVLMNYTGKESKKQEITKDSVKKSSIVERYDELLGRTALFIAKHPVPVLLVVFLIAGIGFSLDNEVPISADQKTFVPSDMPALLNMNKVTRTMGSTNSIPIVVSGDDVLDINTLTWIDEFGDYVVRKNDKVTGVTSIATIISQYNNGELPVTSVEANRIAGTIPEEVRDRYQYGRMETVLEFTTTDMELSQARDLIKVIMKDVQWFSHPPGLSVKVTGTLEMFTNLMDEIQKSKSLMTILGFAFILAFLLVVYRRIHAVSPLIPIVAIVGWNGAIMYISGLEYTPLTAVLGSMTIGVASEYTILIMERCDEELAKGLPLHQALQVSVQKIGTAITVSGMTTVFGFAALMLSQFNIVANFGITTVVTVGFSLLGAILIMPAVISLMYRFEGHKAPGNGKVEYQQKHQKPAVAVTE